MSRIIFLFMFFITFISHAIGLEYSMDIQYGAVSFDCPYGCGNTEYDFRARDIATILSEAVRRVFSEYDCKLPDKDGYWQCFRSAFICLDNMDCGEIIGYYVDGNTKERSPTTMAIIHYSKKGAHLVPARPKK